MKIELCICDAAGDPRPWQELERELEAKIVAVGVALYGNTLKACEAFKISRSTHYRLERQAAAPKPRKEQRRPLRHVAPTQPATARTVVSDLNFLEARDRFDPLWPADKDAELRRLAALNLSTGVISAELGRSYQATERRLAKLGIRPLAGKLERENAL